MTKRRAARKKKPEGSGKAGLEEKVLMILGEPEGGSLAKETLLGSSRTKLVSASRLLGLTGFSRLGKDELVDRLWDALRFMESPQAEEKREAPPPAPPPNSARSRVEFEAHKYSLTDEEPSSAAPESSLPKYIPWSYGRDRVRAVAVDPERLYVYWEITDEARERARAGLGAGATSAWLNLRVYDTTERLFDGTNAHSYFDHRVENGSRQWFFEIGKPGSEAFVEIGMKSLEGYFVRIARSGKVSFPRRSPAPHREPQWLTVRVLAKPAAEGGRVLETTLARQKSSSPVAIAEPVQISKEAYPVIEQSALPVEQIGVEPREERELETKWESPLTLHVWEEGVFALPENFPEPVWETYAGETSTFEVDGHTHVVFGPWRVVVRGLGAFEERRVLSRWLVYRSFAVGSGGEARLEAASARMLGSSALFGASERRLRGASELRLGGASELFYRGASERRLGGATELIYRAASERRYAAASEKLLRGASERRLGGASERR